MTNVKFKEVSKTPGLYAGGNLLADWDILVTVGRIRVEGTTLKKFYTDDPGDVIIPEGIEIIADGCFRDCSNLYSIALPSTLKEVGANAFKGCVDLEGIVLPNISMLSSITFK